MTYARQMLDSGPQIVDVDANVLAAAIRALDDCAQACTADVDHDLGEPHLHDLVTCIRLCLDCADICGATERVMSRQSEQDASVARLLLEACVAICRRCGDECEKHAAMHEHCRVCAEACRRCERACHELLVWRSQRSERSTVPG